MRVPGSRRARATLLAIAALVLHGSAVAAQAQDAARAVRGRVVDALSGQGISSAIVTLAGRDTIVIRTGTDGEWQAQPRFAGSFELQVRALGFRAHQQAVTVGDAHPTDIMVRMNAAPLGLDRVVVTAARREQQLADVVTTTELVTRADIERTGASDLASVLLEQAGIELQGGHPAGSGIMLQGIGSERVLVLLDGQPVTGRISGVFDISRLPTSMVERVEIVKGPQSTLYGSEAMGGVVNVITRSPVQGVLGSAVTATAGSQGRRDATAAVTLGRGDFASAIDVSRRSTETTPGRASLDGALALRLDAAAKLRWSPDTLRWIEGSVLALDERQRWRTGTFYNFGDNVQYTGRIAGAWQHGAHRLTPTVSASSFDHLSRGSTLSKPIAGDDGDRQLQRLYQGELLYNGRFGAHAVDVGTLVRRDEMETERVTGGLRAITTVEPFAQVELAATDRIALLPGVRVSRSSQWGTHVTPRIASRIRVADALTVRASLGEGYRAPDFKELYMFFQNTSAGYAVQGNPDLRPEESRNATIGAEWSGAETYLRGQVFWNEFRDFIETRPITAPGEAPVYEYRNVDNGSTRGVELEMGVALRRLRLEGGYNGLLTRDEATGDPLLGRPQHSARATASAALPFALRTSITSAFTGRTPMQRDATTGLVTSWRDAFFRVDARIARRIGGARGIELVLGADNLLDQQPAEWAGFTGRHVYTGLSWSFNTMTSKD